MNRRDLLKSFVALCSLPVWLLHSFRSVEQGNCNPIGDIEGVSFTLEGLPLPIVHRDFEYSLLDLDAPLEPVVHHNTTWREIPHSLVDCARARGLSEADIKAIEEYEASLKRHLIFNGVSVQ